MDVMDAIQNRRTIGKVKEDPIEEEIIKKILEMGTYAPNHYRTEPWKFFVLTGEGRERLGQAYKEIAKEDMNHPLSSDDELALNKHYRKAFRAPVVIAVAVTPSDQPHVIELEEYAAVSAAIQNMLLTAHALGLGAIWRTGKPCYHERMNEAFHLSDNEKVLGLIYIGYPHTESPVGKRISIEDKTTWITE